MKAIKLELLYEASQTPELYLNNDCVGDEEMSSTPQISSRCSKNQIDMIQNNKGKNTNTQKLNDMLLNNQ